MAVSITIEGFREIVKSLSEKHRPHHEGEVPWEEEMNGDEVRDYNLKIPPWICQPYYRLPPDEHKQKLEEKQREAESGLKEKYFDQDGNVISRNRMKKLKRLEHRAKAKVERFGEICCVMYCQNTRGLKCDFAYCRICCKKKCHKEKLNCSGHKLFVTRDKNRGSADSNQLQQSTVADESINVMESNDREVDAN